MQEYLLNSKPRMDIKIRQERFMSYRVKKKRRKEKKRNLAHDITLNFR